ncbi:hypothetical protein MIND_00211600 [Mycena indigotica]|uniref:Uncharacterized protein n=1 Tax=Mycena indigotica TaxID=2126181 RepID=A0A8H6T8N9_9AGAR|nr:uncharacterized protein MIND_00211600 [Mycena indigotica]KAF7311997.1 hypothetical protein MIND_00211600 [Mycena indigotica]
MSSSSPAASTASSASSEYVPSGNGEASPHVLLPAPSPQKLVGKSRVRGAGKEVPATKEVLPGTLTLGVHKLKAKPPYVYGTAQELLAALRAVCLGDAEVDFSGSYPLAEEDPGVSDKQRVQIVVNDVWRATGYKFTIKDHPPMAGTSGHKTRLWCAQDAGRRQSSKRPNADAKSGNRRKYACRSSLMVACAANEPQGRLITVRLHHHLRHETFGEDPPDIATLLAMVAEPAIATTTPPVFGPSRALDTRPPPLARTPNPSPPAPISETRPSRSPPLARPPNPPPTFGAPIFVLPPPASLLPHALLLHPHRQLFPPPMRPPPTPAEFQRRMTEHVRRLRGVCGGARVPDPVWALDWLVSIVYLLSIAQRVLSWTELAKDGREKEKNGHLGLRHRSIATHCPRWPAVTQLDLPARIWGGAVAARDPGHRTETAPSSPLGCALPGRPPLFDIRLSTFDTATANICITFYDPPETVRAVGVRWGLAGRCPGKTLVQRRSAALLPIT